MNTDWNFTIETCPYSNDGDRIDLSVSSDAGTWAGEPPWDYLIPLNRHGFLPLDALGPFPTGTRITRIMPAETMEEATDFIASALDLLEPDLGPYKYLAQEIGKDFKAKLFVWESNPNWSLAMGVAKPCQRYPDPTVILWIRPRLH
ncbi:hypothetical protein OB03_01675 [Brevundimonas sp. GN22]